MTIGKFSLLIVALVTCMTISSAKADYPRVLSSSNDYNQCLESCQFDGFSKDYCEEYGCSHLKGPASTRSNRVITPNSRAANTCLKWLKRQVKKCVVDKVKEKRYINDTWKMVWVTVEACHFVWEVYCAVVEDIEEDNETGNTPPTSGNIPGRPQPIPNPHR